VDKQVVALLIPIFALAIPVSAIIFHGLQRLARMRLEEARLQLSPRDKETEAEITLLREEVGDLRRELSDVQERLDFAERLLSRTREAERLPGGAEPKA
jgi:predicted nuclease with TOPRIM domain